MILLSPRNSPSSGSMSKRAVGVMAAIWIGAGCSAESFLRKPMDGGGGEVIRDGGAGGTDAPVGSGGAGGGGIGGATDAGSDAPGTGGTTSTGGATGTGGAGAAMGTDAATDAFLVTFTCPTTIDGVLDTTDQMQTGRESRIPLAAACGVAKGYPGNAADTVNPHLFDVYHFVNSTGDSACFDFTLTYDGTGGLQRYLTVYTAYDPTNIGNGYLGDVGAILTSPQTMAVTVPAASSIDVVVFAIDVAPAGVGSYTLKCGGGSPDAGSADGGGADGGGADGGGADGGGTDGGGTDGGDAAGSGGSNGSDAGDGGDARRSDGSGQ